MVCYVTIVSVYTQYTEWQKKQKPFHNLMDLIFF